MPFTSYLLLVLYSHDIAPSWSHVIPTGMDHSALTGIGGQACDCSVTCLREMDNKAGKQGKKEPRSPKLVTQAEGPWKIEDFEVRF